MSAHSQFTFMARVLPLACAAWVNFAQAEPGPLSPEDSQGLFQFESTDLEAEIAAAEPQVIDPIAFCFDSAGDLYVVESPGYPHSGKGLPESKLGRIVRLRDADQDGRFEQRTVFAQDFVFPNGIVPWNGGFFVTAAPNILYLKDTDGNGHADQRRVVLTGFNTDSSSEQLRVACPTLGPDGWVYLTSGLAGAKVTSPLHPGRDAVELKRNDGRFHPRTLEFEALPTAGQYGQAFDHHGRRFVNTNRNPLQWCVNGMGTHPVLDLVDGRSRTFPLAPDTTASSFIPKLMGSLHAGTFTSACGLAYYTGARLPGHRGAFFICEPAQNLVHCRFLQETDESFTANRTAEGREFLASPDQWFRPVFAATGPDGALYLCDMYRKYIDHPNYLPDEAAAKLDFAAGRGMGRIWRIRSTSKAKPRALPKRGGVSQAIQNTQDAGPRQLGHIATHSGAHSTVRDAILHAAGDRAHKLFPHLGPGVTPDCLEALAKQCKQAPEVNPRWNAAQQFAFHLGRGGKPPDPLLKTAIKSAKDHALPDMERILALRLAGGHNPAELLELIAPSETPSMQVAAINALAPKTKPHQLLSRHAGLGPEPARALITALLRNARSFDAVLDAIDKQQLPRHALSLNQRNRILRSKRHAERAQRLIGTKSTADRKKAYESHREVLAMPAQAARGKPVYQRACAQCHTLGALGHAVGPDLTGLRNQPAEALLLHILDPNREVYATYRLYEVQTHDGDTLAGILTSETPDSVTLVLPLGLRQTLLRSHITQLRASTKSLMPENLETTMTRQELADLLAFMKQ